MLQTTNYQLNQWDPSDRILRTDFNEDNAKLDAALKSQAEALAAETTAREQAVAGVQQAVAEEAAAREQADTALNSRLDLQLLGSGTLSAQAAQIIVPLTDIAWDQWVCVHWLLHPAAGSAGYDGTINYNLDYTFVENGSGPLHLTFWPMKNKNLMTTGVCCCKNGIPFSCSVSYQNLELLMVQRVNNVGGFLAGTQWFLYGQAV